MRRHVGRQAAEVAWWWSLHEDLHAATQALDELAWELHVATQVPAQLVGLAAACEWRWKLGSPGLVVALPVSLARALPGGPARVLPWRAVVPGKDLAGGLVAFLGKDLAEDRHLLILGVPCLHKDLHATMEVPPEP